MFQTPFQYFDYFRVFKKLPSQLLYLSLPVSHARRQLFLLKIELMIWDSNLFIDCIAISKSYSVRTKMFALLGRPKWRIAQSTVEVKQFSPSHPETSDAPQTPGGHFAAVYSKFRFRTSLSSCS
jgi:hypothetical protein